MKATVTFVCGKNDRPLEVQLEPEALLFSVLPGNEIAFVAENDAGEVAWAVQCYWAENLIQLMPAGQALFNITIYENGVRLDDWWKYM